MKPYLIQTAKRLLPAPLLKIARSSWRKFQKSRFLAQGSTTVNVAGILLDIPRHHPLPGLMKGQPQRDQCVGVTARFIGNKYPEHTIIDIGANIGDTAAIISENCSNPLLLVEASDFFHDFLIRNIPKFKNKISVRKVLVADGGSVSGELFHWGGTAEWKESPGTTSIPTEKLGDLTTNPVCFVKTDTDGHDFKILLAGVDWLTEQKPVVLFESQIRDASDLAASYQLLTKLAATGYGFYIVWDDAGTHLLSTCDHRVILDINGYLLGSGECASTRICNFDIACFHENDIDVYEKVSGWWRQQ